MARILKFEQSKRPQPFRWPVTVRNRRWQQRGDGVVRWQTLALLMALVFVLALAAFQRLSWPTAPDAAKDLSPSLVSERWTRPDDGPVAVDPGTNLVDRAPSIDSDGTAPIVYRGRDETGAADMRNAMISATFGFCHSGGGFNCVVDGDTFWLRGEKIRIADIDAPETHPSRCADEASKGAAATRRLQALLNAGPFALQSIDRDADRYGRKLRVVTRGGESLGGLLVNEGLARWYEGGRQPWC